MRDAEDIDVRGRLHAARELLSQGREREAEELVEYVLAHRTGLPAEDMAGSCGLSARLLALRGEQVRAGLLADLAVWLARSGTPRPCQAHAFLDRAHTLHLLGDCEQALACLRTARELAPGHVPAPAPWEEPAQAS
jgi:hypothetical protein